MSLGRCMVIGIRVAGRAGLSQAPDDVKGILRTTFLSRASTFLVFFKVVITQFHIR